LDAVQQIQRSSGVIERVSLYQNMFSQWMSLTTQCLSINRMCNRYYHRLINVFDIMFLVNKLKSQFTVMSFIGNHSIFMLFSYIYRRDER
ncbi:hypothetical protein L9F63_028279, partial [Diploptera punctata]